MAKCSYCDSTVVFGGVKDGNYCFCNEQCQENGALLAFAQQVSEEEVEDRLASVHQGNCPKCQKPGPVDVHTSHSVWSALLFTRWSSQSQLSCLSCGNMAKIKGSAISLFFGWWGFPWGLIMTPIQIGRNLWGIIAARPSTRPSPQLDRMVRLQMAAEQRHFEDETA
jgi:hypothetical protein